MPPKDSTMAVSDARSAVVNETLTWSEIRKHNTETSCWVVLYDIVYDLTSWLETHPGGSSIILQYGGADATDCFNAFHPDFIGRGKSFVIGKVADPLPLSPISADYRKLRADLVEEGLFKVSYIFLFARFMYNWIPLVVCLWILQNWGDYTFPVIIAGALLGLFWQQRGWEGHDYAHHACFPSRRTNDIIATCVSSLLTGFSLSWWKDKHNTHHAASNVHGIDPDIDTTPLLAWSEGILEGDIDLENASYLAKAFLGNQTIGYPVLLTFARFSWALQSFLWTFFRPNKDLVMPDFERICIALHHIFTYSLAYFATGTLLQALLLVITANATTGLLLAIVFSLNHNAMHVYEPSYLRSEKFNFFELQVRTTRNVDPTLFNFWFTGGLNYQIEHHLFPLLPQSSYHLVAPRIKKLCKKHDIPYKCTSLWDGTVELYDRLEKVSKRAKEIISGKKKID